MKSGLLLGALFVVMLSLLAFAPPAVIRVTVPRNQFVGLLCESGTPRIVRAAQETPLSFMLIQCQ